MNGFRRGREGEPGSEVAAVPWGKVLGIRSRVRHTEVTSGGTDEGCKG